MTKEQAARQAQFSANTRKVNYCIYKVSNGEYLFASEEYCLKDERWRGSNNKETFYPQTKIEI
jgi:hypothetical protein